ncbi:MAG: CAP domain-containing protein [Planctomycetota bacterium]|jgi:hypothetical protein
MYALRDTSTGELHTCPPKRSLVIGSSKDADIRLDLDEVAPEHVRVTCLDAGGGQRSLRVVDLDSEGGTRVNGERIAQARMKVGDSLEIQGHSYAFEKVSLTSGAAAAEGSSARNHEPDDRVPPVAPVKSSRKRKSDRHDPEAAQSRKIIIGVVVTGLVLSLLVMFWTQSQDVLPSNWFEARDFYEGGKFVEADRVLDRFERDWAAGDPERLAIIEGERKRQKRFAQLLEAGRKRLIANAAGTARVEQIDALREQQSSGDAVESQAARLLLSRLADLRSEGRQLHDQRAAERWLLAKAEEEAAEKAAADRLATELARSEEAEKAAADQRLASDAAARSAAANQEEAGEASAAELSESVSESTVFGTAEQAVRQGQYARAAEIFREMLVSGSELDVAAVTNGFQVAIRQARAGLEESIEEARTVSMKNDAASLASAQAMIAAALSRTPESSELADVIRSAQLLQARFVQRQEDLRVPGEPVGILDRKLQESSDMEARSAFREAAQSYGDASGVASQVNSTLSQYLLGKASDCYLIAEITDLILSSVEDSTPVSVTLHTGRPLMIAGTKADRLLSDDGREILVSDLSSESLDRILGEVELSPRQRLSTGLLAYRRSDRIDAEARIASAVARDKALLVLANGAVRRGRGDFLGSRGFVVIKGKLLTDRGRSEEKLIEDLASEVKRIRGRNAESWQQGLDELLASGPHQIDLLIPALRLRIDEELTSTAQHSFAKHYAAMRDLRLELDRAREMAMELIRSDGEYFFPFQPPATTLARQSEYLTIQAEVDERVFEVQALWNKKIKAQGPNQSLEMAFTRIGWMSAVLEALGEQTTDIEYRQGWWRSLVDDQQLDLHSFCFDAAERRASLNSSSIREQNSALFGQLSSEEAELARLTNDYREMLGMTPLALDIRLSRAARAHAEEMVNSNSYGHFSSDASRLTVFQRAEAEGYPAATGQIIMTGESATEVLRSWGRASAQHRSILSPRNRGFGIGYQDGHWVQVFGSEGAEQNEAKGKENR